MCRKNIIIASILKPVDDTRIFEKFAISLGQTNKYVINIIGFLAKKNHAPANINFYPIFSFSHFNIKRIFAPILFLKKIFALKPDLIIITTYELLIPALLYKFFKRIPVIYDVRENHFRNILYQGHYPKILAWFSALLIRTLEILSGPFVSHYFIAEKGYKQELKFIGKKFTILENKFPDHLYQPFQRERNTKIFRFLFSGTIAKNFGIFKAIDWYHGIAKFFSNSELVIAGFAPNPALRKQLRQIAGQEPRIKLHTDDIPVSHKKILEEISRADCSLVTYTIDPSTENCFPTKIFENMAFQVPMLMVNHPYWTAYCEKWDCCISMSPENTYKIIAKKLQSRSFYKFGLPREIFWKQEKTKLLEVINHLL